jgi:glycosyltransferase involved in cell wall biosynthesis
LVDIPRPSIGVQRALVRVHGRPVGFLSLDPARVYSPADLRDVIANTIGEEIVQHTIDRRLADGHPDPLAAIIEALPGHRRQPHEPLTPPRLTVAVCTRNRAARIAECLDALEALDYPADRLEVLVVDNAPSDDATERAVRRRARMRYACEPRPGLDWARNRAVLESRGEIIAFTDDDVSVDRGWAMALAAVFAEEPAAMCVTGLVVPDELDAGPQVLFERYGGFGRGFRRVYANADRGAASLHGGTGKFGTGANMAFRREVFDRIGLFDPALDVGTESNGGGDLEMFFRIIKEGHLLVYEPAAVVRHRHRRTYAELKVQLRNNGIGFYAYLARTARAYPDERRAIVRLALRWLWFWNVRRLLISFVDPGRFPRDLILAELYGSMVGALRYRRARARAREILHAFGPQQSAAPPLLP